MKGNIMIDNSEIKDSQIGTENSNYIIIKAENIDWKEIEAIFRDALQRDLEPKAEELAKQALVLSQKNDKHRLRTLIKEYFSDFTKNILTSAAAEIVLKYLL